MDDTVEQNPDSAEEFAVVEVFGHRRLAGRIMEVEKYGTKLLRIDIPKDGDFAKGFTSQMYGGASIFSLTPCDLATVQKANKPYEPPRGLTYEERDDDDASGDSDHDF